MRVTLLLCNHAEVDRSTGLLNIIGGGVSMMSGPIFHLTLAGRIEVPWDQAAEPHRWKVSLLDFDYQPVKVNGQPIMAEQGFEVSQPEMVKPGTPIEYPFVLNFDGIFNQLPPGGYTLQLAIDGKIGDGWYVSFTKTAAADDAAA